MMEVVGAALAVDAEVDEVGSEAPKKAAAEDVAELDDDEDDADDEGN